jgi:hypothetical protein
MNMEEAAVWVPLFPLQNQQLQYCLLFVVHLREVFEPIFVLACLRLSAGTWREEFEPIFVLACLRLSTGTWREEFEPRFVLACLRLSTGTWREEFEPILS